MTAAVEITLFTDPACPFAFSAEPVRWMLRWQYGDQLQWRTRMIVLTREAGEAQMLADGADGLQTRYGMPIARGPHARVASCEPGCRAVVAARLHAPEAEQSLLRRLRVRTMAGGLIDDPDLLAAAASDAGLEPEPLLAWSATDRVAKALEADAAAARSPSARARAMDHRLSGPREERRSSATRYELRAAPARRRNHRHDPRVQPSPRSPGSTGAPRRSPPPPALAITQALRLRRVRGPAACGAS